MVYCVERTKPEVRVTEIVIETASRAKAYRLKAKLEKVDPECSYGVGMVFGTEAGDRDGGLGEGFEEYISKTVKEILGMK